MPDAVAEPWDELNRDWLSQVRPADYRNPAPAACYDMLVIGAGSAGKTVAKAAAKMGKTVAIVENRAIGGVCNNFGCIPSKALLRCGRVMAEARRAERYGVRITGPVEADFPEIMRRMRRLRRKTGPPNAPSALADKGIDVFLGDGHFTSGESFALGDVELSFRKACIATGTGPKALPLPGGDRMIGLTNETLFSLTELPARLAVIGAGPNGCEMAEAFARFGSQVTMIEKTPRILPKDDEEAAQVVRASLEESGVTIVCGCDVTDLRREQGEYVIDLRESNGSTSRTRADQVLLALGRVPLIDTLNLESAGVECHDKGVSVNDRLETTHPNIYAAGDVCSRYKFTHAANAMGHIVVENALRSGDARFDDLVIPWCTYTDPELAQVGLTPRKAEERHVVIDTHKVELDQVARDWIDGREDGLLKVHCRKGTDQIVGATLVSHHAGDLIVQFAQAMQWGVGLGSIAKVIFPFPTHAEALKILAVNASAS